MPMFCLPKHTLMSKCPAQIKVRKHLYVLNILHILVNLVQAKEFEKQSKSKTTIGRRVIGRNKVL